MKKIETRMRKFAVVAMALLVLPSIEILAQTKVNLRMLEAHTGIALLNIESIPQEEPVTITVQDEDGVILFSEKSKGSDYAKMIDFAKIKNGKYYIEVAESQKLTRNILAKADSGFSIQEKNFYLYNHLTRLPDDSKRLLMKFTTNIDEKVSCVIRDNEGHVLHETDIKSEDYAALFNLSNLTSGMYSMTLSSESFSNSRSFVID